MVYFSFYMVNWLSCVKSFLHFWIKPPLHPDLYFGIFDFAIILFRIFVSMAKERCVIFLSYNSFFGFVNRLLLSLENMFGNTPYFSTVWDSLCKIGITASLNCWNHLVLEFPLWECVFTLLKKFRFIEYLAQFYI